MSESIDSDREEELTLANESAAKAPLGGVLARMQVHEPSFTPVERRIAERLRSDGRELVGLSIEELATRVDVSTASVIRFCRRLGYRGLRELMLAFAAEVRGETSADSPLISAEDGFDAIVRKVSAAARQALLASEDVLDREALELATDAFQRAVRIHIFGVGGSAAIAQDAHYRFARLALPVSIVTDAHLQPVVASNLRESDVAFVVSHTGRSREPVDVLEQAKRAGATTILLTSFANTPAARWADIVLLTAPVATAPWGGMAPLRVAQLTVIDMICVAIAGRDDSDRKDFRVRHDAMLARHTLPIGNGATPTPIVAPPANAPAVVPELVSVSKGPVSDQRRVAIEGVQNTRHLGGIRLPNGGVTAPVIYRSGMLPQITPAGIVQLQRLGITTVVDLRQDRDLIDYPTPNLEGVGIQMIRAPMSVQAELAAPDLDDRRGWIASYRSWIDGSQSAMSTLVHAIEEAPGSVLMHCILGEDRTGIASALLLSLINVDEEEILADFRASPNGPGWEFLISAALEHVRTRWGSTAGYFVEGGTRKLALSRARAKIEGRPVA